MQPFSWDRDTDLQRFLPCSRNGLEVYDSNICAPDLYIHKNELHGQHSFVLKHIHNWAFGMNKCECGISVDHIIFGLIQLHFFINSHPLRPLSTLLKRNCFHFYPTAFAGIIFTHGILRGGSASRQADRGQEISFLGGISETLRFGILILDGTTDCGCMCVCHLAVMTLNLKILSRFSSEAIKFKRLILGRDIG